MTSSVMEAPVVFVVLLLSMIGVSDGGWCVCRQDVSNSALQKTIDYACGAGADCGPINQNGACYNPNNVKSHCSYAVNSYYLRKGQTPQACDFAGTAALTQQDPSSNGCAFPASSSTSGATTGNNNGVGMGAGNGASPVTGSGAGTSTGTNTGTGTGTNTGTGAGAGTGTNTGIFPAPVGMNPGSTTPSSMTSSNSGSGGVLGGLGPSGNVVSTDNSGHNLISMPEFTSFLLLILSALLMLRA